MAPQTPVFPASELPEQILLNEKGKRRKDLPLNFDLKRDCELSQMQQYRCEPVKEVYGNKTRTVIECTTVNRLFRK